MLRAADGAPRAGPASPAPHASPLRSVRPGQQPVPVQLVWLLAASLAAVTLLSVAHASLGMSQAASGARARRLMQRPQDEAGLHADPAPSQRAGVADGAGRQGEDGGEATQQQGLNPTTDLATAAGPGLQCHVTPSHSKVALLFLTHGDLPHSDLWTEWMSQAAGLLPRSGLVGQEVHCLKQCDAHGSCARRCGAAAACNPLCVDAVGAQLGAGRATAVLARQHLFSVYVHARPTLKDYPEASIFHGRLIPDRAIAKWGTHALAAAAKRLVEAALLDRGNEVFVLVGDTTVPLYHPAVVWQQLMHEQHSRLDACWHSDAHLFRRRCNPRRMSSPRFLPGQHWRKSSQWFMLRRRHAELLAADREVVALFGAHCRVGWDEELQRHRDCVSDEHYLPSLLAMHGADNETTCDVFGGTFQAWEDARDTPDAGHPLTYDAQHVTEELIARIRGVPGRPTGASAAGEDAASCRGAAAATAAAHAAFLNASAVTEATCAATLGNAAYLADDPYAGVALGSRCVLLARKFSPSAAARLHRLYRRCDGGLGVFSCPGAKAGQEAAAQQAAGEAAGAQT